MNPYVLITGASAGIGKAYAYAFAKRSYNLVLVARRKERLQEIQADIKALHDVDVLYYDADLTQQRLRESIIKKVQTLPLGILVNNAGFGDHSVFETSVLEKQLSMIELNIKALVHMTHALLPVLRATVSKALIKKSYVMNIGSIAGFAPGLHMANYFATKAYVLSFSEALAEECSRANKAVHVCVVCPGPIQSEFGAVARMRKEKTNVHHLPAYKKPYWYKILTAESLVEYSIKHMMRKKRIIIHGTKFIIIQFLCRFLPRILITKIVAKINQKITQENV